MDIEALLAQATKRVGPRRASRAAEVLISLPPLSTLSAVRCARRRFARSAAVSLCRPCRLHPCALDRGLPVGHNLEGMKVAQTATIAQ